MPPDLLDRKAQLRSIPSRLGVKMALRVAAGCHLGTVLTLAVLPLVFAGFPTTHPGIFQLESGSSVQFPEASQSPVPPAQKTSFELPKTVTDTANNNTNIFTFFFIVFSCQQLFPRQLPDIGTCVSGFYSTWTR